MTLITIPKKKTVAPHTELLSDIAAEIDEYGRLAEEAEKINAKIKELQAKLEPFAAAKKALAERIEQLELDDDVADHVEKGLAYQVKIGKRGASRAINSIAKVREMMGDELFEKVATVPLKDIDAYLTLPQREEVLDVTRTAHSFKVTKR